MTICQGGELGRERAREGEGEREGERERESVMFVDCFMVLLVMKMLVELASPRSIVFHVHREMGRCLWHPKNHIKAC